MAQTKSEGFKTYPNKPVGDASLCVTGWHKDANLSFSDRLLMRVQYFVVKIEEILGGDHQAVPGLNPLASLTA